MGTLYYIVKSEKSEYFSCNKKFDLFEKLYGETFQLRDVYPTIESLARKITGAMIGENYEDGLPLANRIFGWVGRDTICWHSEHSFESSDYKHTGHVWDAMYEDPNFEASAYEAPTPDEPTAWMYELARSCGEDGYTDWSQQLSVSKPNVPKDSIRNLVKLYATKR